MALRCLIGIRYAGARATYHLDLDKSTPVNHPGKLTVNFRAAEAQASCLAGKAPEL